MRRSGPEVAQCEDYDSDESSVRPGTRKEARRKTTTGAPPKSITRYQYRPKGGNSDSGYSSHGTQASSTSTSAQAALAMPPPPRPPPAQAQARPKPVIHRSESQRSRPRAPSRSGSASRQSGGQCDDTRCTHPTCLTTRNAERRHSISQQYSTQYATQQAASPAQYQHQTPQYPQQTSQYQYQYAQVPQVSAAQTVPTLVAQPRPRSQSTSQRARPASMYATPTSYDTAQPGTPASASAYQSNVAAAWQHYYYQLQQQQAYQQAAYRAAQASQPMSAYPQASPIATSPTSPNWTITPTLQRAYSTRVTTPATTGYEGQTAQARPTNISRTTSARQPSARTSAMPGTYPGEDGESSETSSSSESDSEMSEGEYERERRARARDSRLMSSSSQRRPSLNERSKTTPVVPTRSSTRDMIHRNLQSENVLDYASSSDNMDSDRTARAVLDRSRTTYTGSSRSSRRPSVSTTASSNKTKATTMSSATSGMASLVLEGKNGRHISYLSKRDQDRLYRQYSDQQQDDDQRRREAIEAYQDRVRGGRAADLTAERLRGLTIGSAPSSHSRRGSRSSSKVQGGDGIKIESGGTVIHVYGDSKIEMRPGEDGAPAQFVIGSASGKDSAYHGSSSKSSSSRVGRSHGGSDVGARPRDTIHEEPEQMAT